MRAALVLILGLAACGADGPPERPASQAPAPGLTVSGTIEVGITGGN